MGKSPKLSAPAPEPKKEELTMGQYEELKELILVVERKLREQVETINNTVAALVRQVTSITPTPRNFPKTKEYTAKAGDTLTKIAKTELGQAGRFTEIATMNYDRYPSLKDNANLIQVGWRLRLPA